MTKVAEFFRDLLGQEAILVLNERAIDFYSNLKKEKTNGNQPESN